ncbi:MAG: Na-translocating system protein MpsC family protein [Bacillus sp. (in: firmicutes)]
MIIVHQLPRTLGELKQAIMKENNQVNQAIFKVGLIEQQISIVDSKIIILAKHKRIPVLEIIESSSDNLAEIIDRLLIEKYKSLLQKNLTERLHFTIELILKDYDSIKEISGTIIILNKKIEEYLAG